MRAESAILSTTDDSAVRALFERLLTECGAGLARVARLYAGAPADAADLAQEIAAALWHALPRFRGECSERAFAYRIAHNRGISHSAARRAREKTTPLVDAPPAVDPRPSAEDTLDAGRRREALWRAIGHLPLGSRAVITLALEGLANDEIAAVLGSTPNSVAVRLTRARGELRNMLSVTEKTHA